VRQTPEPCARRFNQAAQRRRLVAAEMVHDDDIAWLKLRNESLLNIGAEAFAVERAVEQARCDEPVAPQGAEEGQWPPVAVWREASHPASLFGPIRARCVRLQKIHSTISPLSSLIHQSLHRLREYSGR
jgi:hypothetical protein